MTTKDKKDKNPIPKKFKIIQTPGSGMNIKENKEILDQLRELTEKVKEISEGDDLEAQFEGEEKPKRSVMFNIDPTITDSFGDSIELTTKSRLNDANESLTIAKTFVEREYANMIGNRYGKHSKLIPVYNNDGTKNKIDMTWFSGCKVDLVEINEVIYYKIRLLVYDILVKKLLLSRIPIGNQAREEEIHVTGAGRLGNEWIDKNAPIQTMKPIKYNPGKNPANQIGQVGYDE